MDVLCMIGKKASQKKDEKENTFGSVDDQIVDPLHNN